MSRRPAGNDRAAQNAQTLKALVKLEGNKVCADCKRNKHPRWASWNLGVFVCIRCSGIHRGMGTHISRVKSVDLDAWTDEQLQNILKWGNVRANKYWEAKLAAGHAPSEAKIENFIRTKYESKRWVMDGPIPDPSTLDGDDDVPLNIVQEKAKIERSTSQRLQPTQKPPSQPRPAPNIDLFGDLDPPARPSTADLPSAQSTRTAPPPQPKPAKPQDSLMGLDFFGGSQQSGAGRPASVSSNPASTTNSRGDLKNSILSLYASAPKPQPQSQPSHDRQPSFGGMASPPPQQSDPFGGLSNSLAGLNFSSTPSAPPAKSPPVQSPPSNFAGLSFPSAVPAKAAPSVPQVTSPPPLSGGHFFDMAPKNPVKPQANTQQARKPSNGLDFAFAQQSFPTSPPAQAPPTKAPAPVSKPATNIPADLFSSDDFGGWSSTPAASAPAPAPARAPAPSVSSPTAMGGNDFSSAFNLSTQPKPAPAATPVSRPPMPTQTSNSMFDPWASGRDSSPWGAPEAAPAKPAAPPVNLGKPPEKITPNDISGGWGAPIASANKPARQASVTADEDFGGWTSAASPVAQQPPKSNAGGFGGWGSATSPAPQQPAKPNNGGFGGFGGGSDPFDNPW
jgi:stromal membrane-associated protein